MDLLGIHHLTAVSASIRQNHRFYTRTLGMRLVKRSVNQDDVSAYHLFYADARGTPGTDLTFFDWPVPPERRGTRSIIRTHLRVAGEETLGFWRDRLRAEGVGGISDIVERDGRLTLDFEDAEGQRLALIDDGGIGESFPWERSPVPSEHQIRGLGPIVMSVPGLEPTERIVSGLLGMRKTREYPLPGQAALVHVYEMGPGGVRAEVHVAVQPDAAPARLGAGGVHHVAFRTPTFDEYDAWTERLAESGVPNSGPVDRFWFRSLYLREPNGILFEIATDGPGFGADEDPATLGEKVALPPFFESQRERIVAGLKPID